MDWNGLGRSATLGQGKRRAAHNRTIASTVPIANKNVRDTSKGLAAPHEQEVPAAQLNAEAFSRAQSENVKAARPVISLIVGKTWAALPLRM